MSQSIEGGTWIGMWIKTLMSCCADAAPLPQQNRAAEQIRTDRQAVEAPLIALGANPRERDRIRKQ